MECPIKKCNVKCCYAKRFVDGKDRLIPCIFLDLEIKKCTIYKERPKICREYLCEEMKNG